MVHTFGTHEEAAIYASAKRAEGYHAVILDEGTGWLYGPLAIGGIRVMVSEEAIPIGDDGEEQAIVVPPPPWATRGDGELATTVRLMVVGIAGIGLAVAAFTLFWILLQLIRLFSSDPLMGAWAIFHLLKYPLVIGLAFAAMGPVMLDFTRWLRGEEVSEGAALLRWVLLALLVPFLLLAAL